MADLLEGQGGQDASACTTILVTTRRRSCIKVMFSIVSVILSTGVGGFHVTITHDALGLTI